MRRPPRPAALILLVGALCAASCAEIDDDDLAAIDEAAGVSINAAERFGGPDPAPLPGPDELRSPLPTDGPDATTPTTAGRGGTRPETTQFRCPFDKAGLANSRCGKIELPGRGIDDEYTINLAFVRFSATGDDADKRDDPVVYLHGGPGGAILDEIPFWYESIVAPHIDNRDVILYDQRGGGHSSPLPVCHEATTVGDRFSTEAVDHQSLTAPFLAALDQCAGKFRDLTDVDTTAFSSAANAQDLVDLMWALGITEYNLHGSSYGTRLAQTVMRDAPDGVRSIVLSGSYPIEANLMGSVSVSMQSSLNAVFDGCAASEDCNRALPNPWAALERLVADLDTSPMVVEIPTTYDATFPIAFDGTDFLNALHSLLYVGFEAASIPDLLIDHVDGDDRRIERLARNSLFDITDTATFLLVQCADEGPFTDEATLIRPLDHDFLRAVELAPAINGLDSLTICESWDTGPVRTNENDPVTWDVPTLLLAGAVDPITPPEWAVDLADNLPRSRLVVQAGAAHDSDDGFCALRLIADFVDQPDVLLDASCAANEAELLVNDQANRLRAPMEIVDISLDLDGDGTFTDLRLPDWFGDWHDDVHIRWRALDNLDPTALILLAPDSGYELTDHLSFGGLIPDWVEAPRSSVPPGWTRWTMETTGGNLISYVRDTDSFEIALAIEPGETEDLERTVLLAAAASAGPNR